MVKRLIGTGTTGSDGSCVIPYNGTGAGLVNLSVETEIDGSIVSEIYSVLDCYKKDNGTTDTNIWTVGSATLDRNVDNEYSVLTETSIGSTGIATITGIPFTDYHVEVDVFQVDGSEPQGVFAILDENYENINWVDGVVGEWKHISLDKTNLAVNSRIRIITGGSCTTTRFKNFLIYPI